MQVRGYVAELPPSKSAEIVQLADEIDKLETASQAPSLDYATADLGSIGDDLTEGDYLSRPDTPRGESVGGGPGSSAASLPSLDNGPLLGSAASLAKGY